MIEQTDNPNLRERQPLAGVCVMVTRAEEPSGPLAEQLRRLGAEVVVQPAICITPPADWRPVDDALARLGQFDWLVFSSANGVRYLLERWGEKGLPTPFPRVAAMGPGTAAALAGFGLRADLVPEQFRAEALAAALVTAAAGRRFLLARASRGRDLLAKQLIAAGATVEQIVVYTSTDVERPEADIAVMLRAGRIDWVTVTSSAIARSLGRLFGGQLRRARLASISPLTSGVLRELGYQPAVEAAEYNLAGLVERHCRGVESSTPPRWAIAWDRRARRGWPRKSPPPATPTRGSARPMRSACRRRRSGGCASPHCSARAPAASIPSTGPSGSRGGDRVGDAPAPRAEAAAGGRRASAPWRGEWGSRAAPRRPVRRPTRPFVPEERRRAYARQQDAQGQGGLYGRIRHH